MSSIFEGKRVLVTGASGFIGSRLMRSLNGAEIYVTAHGVDLNRPLYGDINDGDLAGWAIAHRILPCDLRNRDDVLSAVAASEPEYVFHLGALTQVTEAAVQPYNAMMTNAIGTLNLIEACRTVVPETHIVVSTTDKVYGHIESGERTRAFSEMDRLDPEHPYDVSKACADLIAMGLGRYYDMNVAVARFANVYGPGDTNWKRLIPGLLRWGIEGTTPIIRSDGKQVRQYIYVKDVIDAMFALAQYTEKHGWVGAWNFASLEKPATVMEILGICRKTLEIHGYQMKNPVVLDQAQDESEMLVIDPSNAYASLNWRARWDLDLGVHQTLKWISKLYAVEVSDD